MGWFNVLLDCGAGLRRRAAAAAASVLCVHAQLHQLQPSAPHALGRPLPAADQPFHAVSCRLPESRLLSQPLPSICCRRICAWHMCCWPPDAKCSATKRQCCAHAGLNAQQSPHGSPRLLWRPLHACMHAGAVAPGVAATPVRRCLPGTDPLPLCRLQSWSQLQLQAVCSSCAASSNCCLRAACCPHL